MCDQTVGVELSASWRARRLQLYVIRARLPYTGQQQSFTRCSIMIPAPELCISANVNGCFGRSRTPVSVKPYSDFDAIRSRSNDVDGGYGVMSMELGLWRCLPIWMVVVRR